MASRKSINQRRNQLPRVTSHHPMQTSLSWAHCDCDTLSMQTPVHQQPANMRSLRITTAHHSTPALSPMHQQLTHGQCQSTGALHACVHCAVHHSATPVQRSTPHSHTPPDTQCTSSQPTVNTQSTCALHAFLRTSTLYLTFCPFPNAPAVNQQSTHWGEMHACISALRSTHTPPKCTSISPTTCMHTRSHYS